MAVFYKLLFFFCFCVLNTFGEPYKNTRCNEKCSEYVDENNSPSIPMGYNACSRGCVFYDVISSTRKNIWPVLADNNESSVKIECENSCDDSYNETISVSCKKGCTIQEAIMEVEILQAKREQEVESSTLMKLHPVMQIREISTKVLGMLRIIQTSMTMFFMREDDQTMVAVQGPTSIQIEEIPMDKEEILQNDPMLNDLSNILPGFVEDTNKIEPEKITLDKTDDYPKVQAVLDVPTVPLVVKYAIASGLATMMVVCLGLLLCMITPTARGKKSEKEESTQAPPLPTKDNPFIVKVIRTEDLTKLSLDEDEKSANKIALKMPESSQI